MLIYWFTNICLGIIFIDNYEWSISAFLYIYAVCIAFAGGYLFSKQRKYEQIYNHIDLKKLKIILACSIMLGISNFVTQLLFYDFSLKDLFSLSTLLAINNAIAVERYTNNTSPGILSQVLLPFIYFSPLLGGYLYPLVSNKKDKVLSFLSLIPCFLVLLILNTKIVFISSFILWLSSYFVSFYKKNRRYIHINKFSILKNSIIFACSLGVLFVSMMFRIGRFDIDTFFIVKYKFASYAIGHMGAFDSWFLNYRIDEPLHFGNMTFLSISNLLGLEIKAQGVFTDYFYTESITTNVYTSLRALILDFGILSSIIVFFFIGVAVKKCSNGIFSKNVIYMAYSETFLVCTYSYILFSFASSIFSYTSYIVAFMLLFISLVMLNNKERHSDNNEI